MKGRGPSCSRTMSCSEGRARLGEAAGCEEELKPPTVFAMNETRERRARKCHGGPQIEELCW